MRSIRLKCVWTISKVGRYTRTFGNANGANLYRLRDRHARPTAQDTLSIHREGRMGDLHACYATSWDTTPRWH